MEDQISQSSVRSVRSSNQTVRGSFHKRRQSQLATYLTQNMNIDIHLAHAFIRIHQTTTLAETLQLFLTDDQGLSNHYYIPSDSTSDICKICEKHASEHRQVDNVMVSSEISAEERDNLEYLSSMSEREDSQPRKTCEICYIEVLESDMVRIKGILHNICLQCMDRYIREEISSMRVETIACPHCSIPLPTDLIRQLVDTPTYNKYRLFLRNLQIQKSPNLKWCPNPKCSVVVNTNPKKKTSKCPKCSVEICNKCNRQAHPRSSCEGAFQKQIKGWQNASDIQKCKKCQGLVQKIAGCNHMTCSICHHEWCWLCGSTYSPAHFSALNPFGCPGLQDRPRDDWGKCKILLLRLGLLVLFIIAIPVVLPVAMIVCGPILIGNLMWNNIYPEQCWKKSGIVIIASVFGLIADPIVWVCSIVYFLPKGIQKLWQWHRTRREIQSRRQSFLQQRLLGEQVYQEQQKLVRI